MTPYALKVRLRRVPAWARPFVRAIVEARDLTDDIEELMVWNLTEAAMALPVDRTQVPHPGPPPPGISRHTHLDEEEEDCVIDFALGLLEHSEFKQRLGGSTNRMYYDVAILKRLSDWSQRVVFYIWSKCPAPSATDEDWQRWKGWVKECEQVLAKVEPKQRRKADRDLDMYLARKPPQH
jgi:hypothetical protein